MATSGAWCLNANDTMRTLAMNFARTLPLVVDSSRVCSSPTLLTVANRTFNHPIIAV